MPADFQINVVNDLAMFTREIRRLKDKSIRIAEAKALTATAKEAASLIKDELPRHFTIRGKWVPGGIRANTKPAYYKNPTMYAEVGSVDEFMEEQATGGMRRVGKSGIIAVPDAARRTPQMRMTQANWPGRLRQKDSAQGGAEFVKDGAAEHKTSGRRLFYAKGSLYKKTGRKKASKRYKGQKVIPAYPIKRLWEITDHANIKAIWPFERTVQRAVEKSWPDEMVKALDAELRRHR